MDVFNGYISGKNRGLTSEEVKEIQAGKTVKFAYTRRADKRAKLKAANSKKKYHAPAKSKASQYNQKSKG